MTSDKSASISLVVNSVTFVLVALGGVVAFLSWRCRLPKPLVVSTNCRSRTLRLFINTDPAASLHCITVRTLRSALEKKFGVSLPESNTILSLAPDLSSRLCATVTLDEHGSHTFPQNNFALDLELDADSKLSAQVTLDTDFLGITTLYDGATGKDAVDILAVPGLGSHAFGSFRSTNSGENWLRDYLPRAQPNVRVLLYGYDSCLVDSNAKESITDLARRLLTSIHAHRRHGSSRQRPIVIICHSLGGLLVKEALSLALDSMALSPDNENLFRACYGLVFFGVPNDGLRNEQLRAMVESQPSNKLIDDLIVDSDSEASPLLKTLATKFSRCCTKQDFSILSFYERESSHTVTRMPDGQWTKSGPKKLLVTEESATRVGSRYDMQTRVALRTDHSGLVKFKHRNDPNYADVVQPEIERMILNAAELVHSRFERSKEPLNDQERACVRDLTHAPLDEIRNRISDPCTGTFQWFFEETSFEIWRDTPSPSGLWITGPPGQGKSVLAKFIVQHLEDRLSPNNGAKEEGSHVVISFFCFSQDPNYRQATNILQALIVQLLDSHESFTCLPTGCRKPTSFLDMSIANQWDLLLRLIAQNTYRRVYCVIDAFDECENDCHRDDLLSRFAHLMSASQHNIKLFITSRDGERDIERHLRHIPHYILKPRPKDLQLFIRSKVDDLESDDFGQGMKDEITDALDKKAGNTFLWVSAITRQLADLITPSLHEIRKIMVGSPESLDALYNKTISQLVKERVFARILTWITYSMRPLRLEELEDAITYDPTLRRFHRLSDMAEFRVQITRSFVRKRLGTILEVRKRENWGNETADYVFFTHQSIRDFLCLHGNRLLVDDAAGDKQPRADSLLTSTCMSFLHAEEICRVSTDDEMQYSHTRSMIRYFRSPKGHYVEPTFDIKSLNDQIGDLARRYPLFAYACAYWYKHLDTPTETDHAWTNIYHLLNRELILFTVWVAAHSPNILRNAVCNDEGLPIISLSDLAIQCDIYWLTDLILSDRFEGEDFTVNQVVKMSSIAPCSFRLLCRVLEGPTTPAPVPVYPITKSRISINQALKPVALAIKSGRSRVIQALLDYNTYEVLDDDREAFMIALAVEKDDHEVLYILLGQQLDPDDPQLQGLALHAAVRKRHIGAVHFLLKIGGNVNARAHKGFTPLMQAASSGCLEIVNFLMNAGANVNMINRGGCTPLIYAVYAGDADVAKALLEQGADPHLFDRYGKNALHHAIEFGHPSIAMLLLEAKCNPNSLDKWSETPLHSAAQSNDPVAVQALLSHGANPLLLDDYGRSSLDWASAYDPCFKAMGVWASQYTATPLHASRSIARKRLTIWLRRFLDGEISSPYDSSFYRAGRLLLRLGGMQAACIAFEAGLYRGREEIIHTAYCDAGRCQTEIKIRGFRYLCKSCADTDFCESCFQSFRSALASNCDPGTCTERDSRPDSILSGDSPEISRSAVTSNEASSKDHATVERCNGHEFIKLPRDEWTGFEPGCVDEHGTTIRAWVSNLHDRYSKAESASRDVISGLEREAGVEQS